MLATPHNSSDRFFRRSTLVTEFFEEHRLLTTASQQFLNIGRKNDLFLLIESHATSRIFYLRSLIVYTDFFTSADACLL